MESRAWSKSILLFPLTVDYICKLCSALTIFLSRSLMIFSGPIDVDCLVFISFSISCESGGYKLSIDIIGFLMDEIGVLIESFLLSSTIFSIRLCFLLKRANWCSFRIFFWSWCNFSRIRLWSCLLVDCDLFETPSSLFELSRIYVWYLEFWRIEKLVTPLVRAAKFW